MSLPLSAFDRQWRKTTIGLVIVMSLVAFEAMAVATALPTTVAELDGLAYYGWPFTAFLILNILGMVTAGGLGDRVGPRLPLVGGMAVFTTGLVLAGIAQNMALFVLGRAVQGLGSGFIIVAVYIVIGLVYPVRVRPKVFAATSAAWVIPALIGPPIAGALTEHLTWRLVFLGLPPCVAVGLLLLRPALSALPAASGTVGSRSVAVRRTLAALGAGLGIALVLYAGQRLDLVAIIALMAGVVLLAMSGRRLLPPGTVAVRNGLPAVIAFRGMLAGAFFAVDALLPLTLTAVHGYGPTAAGIPLMTGAVGWSTGSWVQGRYPDVARYLFVRTGFILLAVSCVAMVLIVTPAGVAWVAYPIWLVAGTGMGLAMPGVGILLLELSPPEQRGANAAAMQICDVSVSALCIGAAGVLVAASENGLLPLRVAVGTVDLAMGMFAVAGALLAYRVRATTRTELVSA